MGVLRLNSNDFSNQRYGPQLSRELQQQDGVSSTQETTRNVRTTQKAQKPAAVELADAGENYYFTPDSPTRHYYLEIVEDPSQAPIDSIELPYVSRVECELPLAVARTYTIAGLYEEHSGFVERAFTLAGRSGYDKLDIVRFHKLRNFLEKYAKLSADNKNAFVRGKDVRLVLNFPWEGESYYATMMLFRPMSSAGTSRVSYEYSIVLKAYALAARKWSLPANIVAYLDSPGVDARHTGLNHPCFRDSVGAYKDVPPTSAYIYKMREPYDEALEIERTMGPHAVGLDNTMLQTLYQVVTSGYDQTYALWEAADYELWAVERLTGRFTTIVGWLAWIQRQVLEMLGVQFRHIGDTVDGSPTNSGVAPIPNRESTEPVTVVTAQDGDRTAADVAYRYLGSRGQWLRIVQLNGMLDGRTRADGTILSPGHKLLVPLPGSGLPKNQAYDTYGTDIAIGPDGDFVLSGTTGVGLVSGLDNVRQNFDHRFRTVRGTNKAFPEFGLPELIGTLSTSDLPGQVMSAVKVQSLSDHRVTGISALSVTEDGGTIRVAAALDVVANPPVTVAFDYPWK